MNNEPVNYYEKMPKRFLTKTENPNYDLTKISLPCRLVMAAPTGTGKSLTYTDLIHKWCEGKGTAFRYVSLLHEEQISLHHT